MQYQFIFYILLVVAVVIEWPITIIALSLLAPNLWIGFIFVYIFSFLGDFIWEVAHFYFWRIFQGFKKSKDNDAKIQKLNNFIDSHQLIDTLVLIKYTPPLTSIGLLYLGSYLKKPYNFLVLDALLVATSSLIITTIWMYFWSTVHQYQHPVYIVAILLFAFALIYFTLRIISHYYLKARNAVK